MHQKMHFFYEQKNPRGHFKPDKKSPIQAFLNNFYYVMKCYEIPFCVCTFNDSLESQNLSNSWIIIWWHRMIFAELKAHARFPKYVEGKQLSSKSCAEK